MSCTNTSKQRDLKTYMYAIYFYCSLIWERNRYLYNSKEPVLALYIFTHGKLKCICVYNNMAQKKILSVFFCNINSRLCWKYYTFINCIHMAIFLLWTCAARPFPIVPTTVFPRVSILPSSDYLTRINFLNLIIAIFNSLLKVSKNRKQIFQPKLLPKTKPSNLFLYPDK